ncbi:MAG: hypothetical protein V4687_16480 [Bacteroidota bacterium]
MKLTSKLQFKLSEKGEFHNIEERNLADTIALINDYPWSTERSNASVELTCPSITIAHPDGTYLKIGPYFSGKYSLYYLGSNRNVYLKTVTNLEEACEWVKVFFEHEGQLKGFEKYGFTINPNKHFKTNPFVYQTNTRASSRLLYQLFFMIGAAIILSFLKYLDHPDQFKVSTLFYVLLFCLVLCSPLFYLYFNYLDADRNIFLRISRGHDDFTFGTLDNEKTYRKQDVQSIISYGPNKRSLWGECEVFIITFKNGEQIKFTSLLILGSTLWGKFPDHRIYRQKLFFPTYQSVRAEKTDKLDFYN